MCVCVCVCVCYHLIPEVTSFMLKFISTKKTEKTKVTVWLFHFVSRSFQAVDTETMYSSPTSFFFSVNCFCLHETGVVGLKYACSHAQTALCLVCS